MQIDGSTFPLTVHYFYSFCFQKSNYDNYSLTEVNRAFCCQKMRTKWSKFVWQNDPRWKKQVNKLCVHLSMKHNQNAEATARQRMEPLEG